MEDLNQCPVCQSNLLQNHLIVKDYAVSQQEFTLTKCSTCELLVTNPRPEETCIGPYYDFKEYYSHSDQVRTFTQWVYATIRTYSIRKKVDLIQGLSKKGELLDYGCGTGEFLQEASRQGWRTTGIEPSSKARDQAQGKLPNQIVANLGELSNDKTYDVITLFHVLEHVHQLRTSLEKIINHLKSTGYIIIAVPNPYSHDATYYGPTWAGYDVPRHLYHFSKKSMLLFEKEFGLELVAIHPMLFDSYYVSLLSEAYKRPKGNLLTRYIKAILQGYKSNKASVEPGDYSSNIYIYKKK